MVCDVCNTEIAKGERYKSERYKTKHFCSEECYEKFLECKQQHKIVNQERQKQFRTKVVGDSDKTEYTKFLDLLNSIYPKDQQNWALWQRQSQKILEDFGLNYTDLRRIVLFAMEYDNHIFNPYISLTQFFPRYIIPCDNFLKQLKENAEDSKSAEFDIEYVITNKYKNKKNYAIKDIDFDE